MRMKTIIKISILVFNIFSIHSIYAQYLTGKVIDSKNNSLPGATIHWLEINQGVATDSLGKFKIKKPTTGHGMLVTSYIGYQNDTTHIMSETEITVVLETVENKINEVLIQSNSSFISKLNPIKTQTLTSKEFKKAACCNLSESFETNASVDVSYTDGASGAKQIQMLGLDGVYTQIMIENIPTVRGLAYPYGMGYVPGPWISSIDISKGVGSVANGYESITGQINVELIKPELGDRLFVNLYANHLGRVEANLSTAQKLNSKWSTIILTHASNLSHRIDQNNDGFMDIPTFTQYNFSNRWKYDAEKIKIHLTAKILKEDRTGGQTFFSEQTDRGTTQSYGTGSHTWRMELGSKIGIIYPKKPHKGIGILSNISIHNQDSYFGLRNYQGTQQTLYTNFIYQSIIQNTQHEYRVGLNFIADNYNESLNDSTFKRTELVPGVYGEYTYSNLTQLTVVAGGRIDFHNLYGIILTPRLHIKYDITPTLTARLGIGRGFRRPNAIAENFRTLVSSRKLFIDEEIKPEIAWNTGISLHQVFNLSSREGYIDFEVYRTQFENQLIVDMDNSSHAVHFYNLKGQSFATSFQLETEYQVIKRLSIKTAYKLYDVKTTISNQLIEPVMIPLHRFFINLNYSTKLEKWKFDCTAKWTGAQRLPAMSIANGIEIIKRNASSFWQINAQITKVFKVWEIYIGGENLTNFKQENPIVSSDKPFDHGFDASMIWGPLIGQVFYTGVRYTLK